MTSKEFDQIRSGWVMLKSGERNLLCNSTNNYVELWHKTLKYSNLGSSRKRRTDNLPFVLLQEALPDYRPKVAQIALGFDRRISTKIENDQRGMCEALTDEAAMSFVFHQAVLQNNDEYSDLIHVRSFTQPEISYSISLNLARILIHCSCRFHLESITVCKHMFLAQRITGYDICFETRGSVQSVHKEYNLPLVQACENLEKSRTNCDMTRQMISSVLTLINSRDQLTESPEKALDTLAQAFSTVKREFEGSEPSWPKKQ